MNPIRRTRIKFCGMTSVAEAELAVHCGVDAVGVILAESPRRVDLALARAVRAQVPAGTSVVAVLADTDPELVRAALDAGLTAQFSGDESPETCAALTNGRPYFKVFHVRNHDEKTLARLPEAYPGATALFDSAAGGKRGGTGMTFAWHLLGEVGKQRHIVVAGGLTPENVGACVSSLHPYAVDVRSGIESAGVKDEKKMRAFVRAVREANAQSG
jgi:phosphoribosylanthranilate isomerase